MTTAVTESRAEYRQAAEARLRVAMDGLPLSMRDSHDARDYYRQQFVIAANDDRHLAISEQFAHDFPHIKPSPTFRETLEAFARGENELRYPDGHGNEMVLVLWSSEMEQWI